jgi:plasmid stability protein
MYLFLNKTSGFAPLSLIIRLLCAQSGCRAVLCYIDRCIKSDIIMISLNFSHMQVLIRDIEDETGKILKAQAKENGNSFEGELRKILREAAKNRVADYRKTVLAIREALSDIEFEDSTLLLREDRER